jgi:predicted secreted protein
MKSVGLAAAIYFVIWWTVLFGVLPWGVKSQHEAGEISPGSDPGAPVRPLLLKKAIATTLVSAVIMALGYAVWALGLIGEGLVPAALIPPRY